MSALRFRASAAEQWAVRRRRTQARGVEVGRQVACEIGSRRNLPDLAPFLQEPEEGLATAGSEAPDGKPGHCADAGGGVDQNGDDGPVAQANDVVHADRGEQRTLPGPP